MFNLLNFFYKFINRFPPALNGLRYAAIFDSSFRTSIIGGGVVWLCLEFFFGPLTPNEALLYVIAWFLVLITEIQNNAFEEALNRLHPDHHDNIGRSKDMTAGAALLAGILAFIVVIFIILK